MDFRILNLGSTAALTITTTFPPSGSAAFNHDHLKALTSSLSINSMTTANDNAMQDGHLTFTTYTTMTTTAPPPPSATEEEAKRRFNLAMAKGVETLLDRGHGRDRASTELLNEIANGCSPNEEEIFQTMETLGLSLNDATKVITVSTAFRDAAARTRASTNQGSTNNNVAIEAIDDLTSRLNLANLLRGGGGASSPIPTSPRPSATTISTTTSNNLTIGNNMQATEVAVDAFHLRRSSSSMATTKKDQRTIASMESKNSQHQQHGGGRGRKRTLADKTSDLRDSNVMITEEHPSAATKAIDPLEVKEQILNAKLSKVEGSSSTSSSSGVAMARSKSPDGGGGIGGARGMRGASMVSVHHGVEEALASKRPRTRSQTEESIPEI